MALNPRPLRSTAHPRSEHDGHVTQHGGETLTEPHRRRHGRSVVAGGRGHRLQKSECVTIPQNQAI